MRKIFFVPLGHTMFVPQVVEHRHHHQPHHFHGDYGDYNDDDFNRDHSPFEGREGNWVGEEGSLSVTGSSEAEVHQRLDDLKSFL